MLCCSYMDTLQFFSTLMVAIPLSLFLLFDHFRDCFVLQLSVTDSTFQNALNAVEFNVRKNRAKLGHLPNKSEYELRYQLLTISNNFYLLICFNDYKVTKFYCRLN
jgi:hypothetical protein